MTEVETAQNHDLGWNRSKRWSYSRCMFH